jgi:hypothetical protein
MDPVEPVRFRSSQHRWQLAALELWSLWQNRPRLRKRDVLALAWSYTPRKLKLVAGAAAAFALISVAGAVTVLALVLNQLLE